MFPISQRSAPERRALFKLGLFDQFDANIPQKPGQFDQAIQRRPSERYEMDAQTVCVRTVWCVKNDNIGYPLLMHTCRLKRSRHAGGMRDQHGLSSDAPGDIANHLREGVVNCRIVRFDRAVCSHGSITKCFQPCRQWQKHYVTANQSGAKNDNRLAITKAR